MQLNSELKTQKYHLGEDWNGICGTDSDNGASIYAIADGQVVYMDSVGTKVNGHGKELHIRHSFPYAPAPKDLLTFDSAYMHLDGMSSKISWSGAGTGSSVTLGQTVGFLGGTGGFSPHLHWAAVVDLKLGVGVNPYQKPLLVSYALKYRAPSLIVDDRRNIRSVTLSDSGTLVLFTMSGNAPSSTAYIDLNGSLKSIAQAVSAGWISAQGILTDAGTVLTYRKDVDTNFFEDGKKYGVKALRAGLILKIPIPQNRFQQDRARLDMLHAVENDSRFVSIRTETYALNTRWDVNYDLHQMSFDTKAGVAERIYQATNKKNPLVRYTLYYDPSLGGYSAWKQVDRNQLY
jgi:hypothetical protein